MSTDGAAPGDAAREEAVARGYEFSAGGVVVHDGHVAVIVPTRRGAGGLKVLGLPKGHPENGETALQAAAREVREEAGIFGEPITSLGTVEYVYERRGKARQKRVEFFLIEYRGGSVHDHDHEVEEVQWMPLAEAAQALTYEGEREMITRALARLGLDA